MEFKNKLEKECFNIAKNVIGNRGSVEVEHNKQLSTDWSRKRSQIAFSGLPSKEIDVLSLNLFKTRNVYLFVSCKYLTKSRCSPTYIQEWGNVIEVFNKNSINKTYLGIVVCSKGFSSCCESWAMQNNLGIIPPYKGKVIRWRYAIVLKMFERLVTAYIKIIGRDWKRFRHNSSFYWFVYKLITDLEYEV